MGYIITNNPTAILLISPSLHFTSLKFGNGRGEQPIGTLTPTNCPFCNAGPVFGTKFPRMIPIAMARKIHNARNRSSQPRALKAEVLDVSSTSSLVSCFSTSEVWGLVDGEEEPGTTTSSEGSTLGSIFGLVGGWFFGCQFLLKIIVYLTVAEEITKEA